MTKTTIIWVNWTDFFSCIILSVFILFILKIFGWNKNVLNCLSAWVRFLVCSYILVNLSLNVLIRKVLIKKKESISINWSRNFYRKLLTRDKNTPVLIVIPSRDWYESQLITLKLISKDNECQRSPRLGCTFVSYRQQRDNF